MFRETVERRSAVLLVWLRGLPRPLPGLAVLGLVAAGLLVPGALGALALLLVGLVLGWLMYLSWPALPPVGRAVRVVVLGIVVAAAVRRVTGG